MPAEEVLGVVLAGGASRRMGFDKRTLELEGRPLVLRAADTLRAECAEVVVSTQPNADRTGSAWDDPSFGAIPDLRADSGPMAGLEAALEREAESERPVFLLACDLPHVTPDAVGHILRIAAGVPECAAVVPSIAGRIQPLCGLYRGSALPAVRDHLDSGRRAMHELLAGLELEEVVIDASLPFFRRDLFHNLNQPVDLDPMAGARSR